MRKNWLVYGILLAVMILFAAGCANKWKTSGKIAMGQKRWDKAITDFQKALELDPNDGEAHFLIAMSYKEGDEFESMIPHLNAAESSWPKGEERIKELRADTWEELFNAGLKNANSEEFERARDNFVLAIAMFPERYEAYTNAGFVWQRLENSDSALYYYDQAYEIDPDNIKILENFASLCFNIGTSNYMRADSLYAQAETLHPRADSLYAKADTFYAKADTLYSKILELDPKHGQALLRRSDIAQQKGDLATAVSYYKRALEEEPYNCQVRFSLGNIYYQNAIRLADSLELKSEAKSICQLLDDEAAAFAALKKLYPSGDDSARKALTVVKDYCGNLMQAESTFVRVVDICPDEPDAHINLNVVLISLERFDEAIANLETFTLDFPDECVGWDLYSRALLRTGMRKQALEAANKYEECKGAKQ